jgi:hypothetical protein
MGLAALGGMGIGFWDFMANRFDVFYQSWISIIMAVCVFFLIIFAGAEIQNQIIKKEED